MPGIELLSAADVGALASAGLRSSHPLFATSVVAWPPMHDVTTPTSYAASSFRRSTIVVRARRRLLDDLRQQADELAAIGVGAITFGIRTLPFELPTGSGVAEVTATGIPLLAAGRTRTAGAFFRTTLSPADIAMSIRAGWMPADVVVAGDTQLRRWVDRSADAQVVTSRSNGEIPGATRIVTTARSAVRTDLRKQAVALGADGLLVGAFETYWSATRHRVDVVAVGDAIVRWQRHPPAVALDRAITLGAVKQ